MRSWKSRREERLIGSARRRYEGNIKTNLTEIGCEDVELVHLDPDENGNEPAGSRRCQKFRD